jgi:hypothetical protein
MKHRDILDILLSPGDWDLEIIAILIFVHALILNILAWLAQRHKVGRMGGKWYR